MFTLVSEETYEDGRIIIREGSSGDWVYVVLSGSVEISRMIGGKKFIIEVLNEGEVFGELSFLGGVNKRTATITSIGETVVGVIDRDSLDAEYNKLSSDFRAILVAVVRRFDKMLNRASDFNARAEKRAPKSLSVSFKDKQSFLSSYTGNISSGGLFIKTNKPLEQDDEFNLKLQLPDLPEPLKIKCKVAWASKGGDKSQKQPAGMGIKFIEMSENDNTLFMNYLKTIM
ncbi:MAG: TIGR02266 family protein [Deltaproteobacteria bacterium]|nr:TIGR02266 family protein [Deltaproteobacteria bacterium]